MHTRILLLTIALTFSLRAGIVPAQDISLEERATEEKAIRDTAIALNYCRASFHRIRKYPIKPVLAEEKDKILNNLNLQGIEDPEVIQLYTSVLDEINDIQVADQEKKLRKMNFRTSMQRKIVWDLLAFSTDLATAQYGNAIRQGANSWWDYRSMAYKRDVDLFRVDKNRMDEVTRKSSSFLDTFWKLARKKNIPDKWLIRGNDLDQLEVAMAEKDPEVRLRVLRRMEPYMEAFPPYWYYLGKTEQEMGELVAAASTYHRLASLGEGHFRRDDMLAASMANLAAIEEHFGSPDAVRIAKQALEYSPDVWEANLICSRILERHGRIASAEDAILRNLDVELETTQSRVFLASLYYHSDNKTKLAKFLQDREVVAGLPAPVLLRCAACLGPENTPAPVMQAVASSLEAQPRMLIGQDELLVRMSPAWQLHLARLDVAYNGQVLQPVPVEKVGQTHQLRFTGRFSGRGYGRELAPVTVTFTYPDQTVVSVTLEAKRSPSDGNSMIGLLNPRQAVQRVSSTATKLTVASALVDQTSILFTDEGESSTIPVDPEAVSEPRIEG